MSDRANAGRRFPWRMLGALVLITVLVAGAFLIFVRRNATAATERRDYSLIFPQRDRLLATVSASGNIQPEQVLDLNFSTAGTVAEILVAEGDQVDAGQPLARLDSRDLELRLQEAQAALAQSEANYEKLIAGSTPEQIAQAQAQLDQALSQLQQVQGNVTDADIRAAEAQLEQARAALAELEAGPRSTEVTSAQAQLDQARANLASQRDSLSAAKTRAESQVVQAANQLRDAQASYERIYWDNRELEDQLARFGQDLPQENLDREAQALRAVENAEESLRQAQVGFENARQAEVNGLQAAEAQVASAQASLDRLLAGTNADQLAAARAQVAQAEANLSKLRGDQREGSLSASQAQVAQAEANLSSLLAGARPADLQIAQAQIRNAQAGVAAAELALERATIAAPFAGTVAQINIKIGEVVGGAAAVPALRLVDFSSFHVNITIDEIDIARIITGQPVTLTLDALPELALPGEVTRIDALSTEQSAVTAYTVRIDLLGSDPQVRPGMSTNADIVIDERAEALLVPRRAVRNDNGRLLVDVPVDTSLCQANARLPLQPELRQVEVSTGLSNEQVIEIVGGLDQNTCVYVQGFDARLTIFGGNGPPPGVQDRNQSR